MDTDISSEVDGSETDNFSVSDITETRENCELLENFDSAKPEKNIAKHLFDRQLFGRFSKNPRAATEKIFKTIPERCCIGLSELINNRDDAFHHIFMGFTQCGRFLLSYSTEQNEEANIHFFYFPQYILHVWRYIPYKPIDLITSYKIFRLNKKTYLDVTICQWPTDKEKLVVHGVGDSEAYLTIITLPSLQRCNNCSTDINIINEGNLRPTMQCLKHGITIDVMLSIMPPHPVFKPHISLAYPDHVIINTGHYLYALNVSLTQNSTIPLRKSASYVSLLSSESVSVSDNISENSESVKQDNEAADANNIVKEILADFSDFETDFNEYSKPFHELNITCEPLNVTGRSYWNNSEPISNKPRLKMFLHNKTGADAEKTNETSEDGDKFERFERPRLKMFLQKRDINLTPSTSSEKSTIDTKIAEKAYEFTEETEKFEKLSLFRKKRLAEKKYEFSEDNVENIIPFNILRHERKFHGKSGGAASRGLRSNTPSQDGYGYFLSPRSPNIHSPRSPILSPGSRNSPSGSRLVYHKLMSPSHINRKAQLSPRGENNQKRYDIYSPSHIDSDCSDNEAKLVLRQFNKAQSPKILEFYSDANCVVKSDVDRVSFEGGLLMERVGKDVGDRRRPKWIKKFVRRYTNNDFESASSLVSDGHREDCISIEPPVLVHTNGRGDEQQLEVVPSHMSEDLAGPAIAIIHRTFDAEQFCHHTAKNICAANGLAFTFCADYDIDILSICPLSGDVVCSAYIEMGADSHGRLYPSAGMYCLQFVFVWCCSTEMCSIVEPQRPKPALKKCKRTAAASAGNAAEGDVEQWNCRKIRVMTHNSNKSLTQIRDEDNLVIIVLDQDDDNASTFTPDYISVLRNNIL